MAIFPSKNNMPLLLLAHLLLSSYLVWTVNAKFLGTPEFVNRFDTNEAMRQNNGMAGSEDGRVFATTATGNLWILNPLQENAQAVVYTPTPVVDAGDQLSVSCQSSVVLKETTEGEVEYAVYVVLDSDPDSGDVRQSRVLGVDAKKGELLWSVVLAASSAVGTPAVGQEFVYVTHTDVDSNAGRLSLIQVVAASSTFTANIVDTLTSTRDPWGPPSVAAYPEDGGDDLPWREIVAWGDSTNFGRSQEGNLYLLKVGDGDRAYQTLSDFQGATLTAPALGAISRDNNGRYNWNVATGNYGGLVHMFTRSNWNPFLETTQAAPNLMDPAWRERATAFTFGQFPLAVAPVFSPDETFVVVAGTEGGLAAYSVERGQRQWQIATPLILSQPVVFENSNNGRTAIYACDMDGWIRQIEASNRGNVNWSVKYCDEIGLADCPQVSAGSLISRNGNRLYIANEDGSIFGARVGSFATPAPTPADTDAPVVAPTGAPVVSQTAAPFVAGLQTAQPTMVSDQDDDDNVTDDDQTANSSDLATSAPAPSPGNVGAGTDSASSVSDDSTPIQVYILLGVLVFALCMCVGGALVILRRRRSSKEKDEQRIQEEMLAVRRWKSNKKMYHEDMKAEEEATMQELSSNSNKSLTEEKPKQPNVDPAEGLVTPTKQGTKKERRCRSRSRNSRNPSTPGTLDSISESIDEERGGLPTETSSEAGFEISVEGIADSNGDIAKNLTLTFASEDSKETAPKSKSEPIPKRETPNGHIPQETEVESVEESKTKEDARAKEESSAMSGKSGTSGEGEKPNSPSTAPVDNTPAPSPSASSEKPQGRADPPSSATSVPKQTGAGKKPREVPLETFLTEPLYPNPVPEDDQCDLRSNLTGEPGQIRSPPTPEPGAISAAYRARSGSGASASEDDDRSDMTSLLSGISARSGLSSRTQHTEEPGSIKKKVQYLPGSPCPSDLMSVDSSLYLDDNTAGPPVSPPSPASINKPQKTPDSSLGREPPRLAPPDGASVGSPSSSTIGSGDSVCSDPKEARPGSCRIPALSIASDETARKSNNKERQVSSSSTKIHAEMVNENKQGQSRALAMNHPREELYTKPVHMEGSPQTRGRTRAGLFSRQQRAFNSTSSSSTQSVSNMSYDQWSESVSAASASSNATEAMKIVGTASGDDTQVKSKSKPGKSKKEKSAKSEKSMKENQDDGGAWNSFLNHLAKAEEEFFNPTLPKKAAKPPPKPVAPKTKRQYGRKRSGKQSFPPPLPPPSHTDVYFRKEEGDSDSN